MGPTASPRRAQAVWSDHHGLRAAVRDLLEPHPLGIGHGLLRVPKLAAIGHELGDEGCTLLLLENQEPLRARTILGRQHFQQRRRSTQGAGA